MGSSNSDPLNEPARHVASPARTIIDETTFMVASPIKSGRLVTGMVSRWPGSRLGKCRAQPRCPLFVRQVMLRFGRHQAKRVVAPLHPVQHPEGRAAEAGDRLELPLVRVLVPDLGHHAFGLAVRFRPYAIPAHHIKMRRAEHSPARLKNVEKDIITFSSNVCVTKQGGRDSFFWESNQRVAPSSVLRIEKRLPSPFQSISQTGNQNGLACSCFAN